MIKLIENHISCYAMHTNFDVKGMAELAAQKMSLIDCQVLDITDLGEQGPEGIGRVGDLPEKISLETCVRQVKEAFTVDMVKVFGDLSQKVKRAAICPGSGKSVISCALNAKAQVLITGDIDHHEGIDAASQGLAIIDAGHYGIEKLFIPFMVQYLEKHTEGIEIQGQPVKQPFLFV